MPDRRSVALIVAAWLLARLVCSAIFEPWAHFKDGDAAYYLDVARSIAQTGAHSFRGEPTLYRPPAYPAYLAMLPGLPLAAWIGQSLATLAGALLTVRVISGRLGLVTALLIASSPFFIAYEWRLLAEALTIALIWAAWLLIAMGQRRPVAAGLLIGLAALMRDTALFLPLFAALVAVFFDRDLAKRLLVAFVLAYLVTVPWQIRNASLPQGTFALSDGRAGFNLWIGTWERNGDWFLRGLDNANYPADAFRTEQERTRLISAYREGADRPFRDVALDRIASRPLGTAKTWAVRYPRLWLGTRSDQIDLRPERGSPLWTGLKAGFWSLNALTLLAGLAGFVMAVKKRSRWLVFALPIAWFAAIYIPFHNVETRYSLPALPFIYVFAAYLVTQWMRAEDA